MLASLLVCLVAYAGNKRKPWCVQDCNIDVGAGWGDTERCGWLGAGVVLDLLIGFVCCFCNLSKYGNGGFAKGICWFLWNYDFHWPPDFKHDGFAKNACRF